MRFCPHSSATTDIFAALEPHLPAELTYAPSTSRLEVSLTSFDEPSGGVAFQSTEALLAEPTQLQCLTAQKSVLRGNGTTSSPSRWWSMPLSSTSPQESPRGRRRCCPLCHRICRPTLMARGWGTASGTRCWATLRRVSSLSEVAARRKDSPSP